MIILIIFQNMAVFIYIFIFLLLSFGPIESKAEMTEPNRRPDPYVMMELSSGMESGESFFTAPGIKRSLSLNLLQPSDDEIVMNEIMADPTPVAGLPDREFLELYNPGIASVNLKNWMLELGSKQKFFADIIMEPGGFLLVTSTGGAKDLQKYGKVIEISGFTLTNSGLTLSLYNPLKELVDQLIYLPSMHTKQFAEGGYSLERIDPERLCGQSGNWLTTLSGAGGTPGAENTIRATNTDRIAPHILATTFVDKSRLQIQFSERVIKPVVQMDYIRNITFGVVVDSIRMDQNSFVMKIFFNPASILNGINYSLDLFGMKDECGNVLPVQTLKFGFYQPVKSDLLISEVLFNPFPDGTDFIEIYNNSGHEVDLSGLFLATRDDSKMLKQFSQVSVIQKYIAAGAYLAVTKSLEGILLFYRTKCQPCLLNMDKFPTLSDLSGSVVLLDMNLEIIDEMSYNEGMHHPLITEKEGISLERISFEKQSSRRDNWNSAAESTGFATPGYQNSAREVADSTIQAVIIEPAIFSPNGDGINDQLKIRLNSEFSGWILNITILNYAGKTIRNLANNITTGSSDMLYWDGLDSDSQNVDPGIYILNVSLFHQSGNRRTMRIACVVTDRI